MPLTPRRDAVARNATSHIAPRIRRRFSAEKSNPRSVAAWAITIAAACQLVPRTSRSEPREKLSYGARGRQKAPRGMAGWRYTPDLLELKLHNVVETSPNHKGVDRNIAQAFTSAFRSFEMRIQTSKDQYLRAWQRAGTRPWSAASFPCLRSQRKMPPRTD